MKEPGGEHANLDALGLAALLRKGELSASEVIDDAIERCERVNGTLNAVVTEMFDHARAAAAAPLGDGPFAGVPFLMKDFGAEVAGVRFTEGSAFLADYVPTEDAELYRRYRNAGLITIGKTNTPELAVGATTEGRFLGAARNPWDPTLTPGGSSGGAAAAVAARIVPVAHANDIGGSIRIPAACCGLVGLKPTRGRTTLAPHYGDILAGFFVEHAVTRSVRDCAALLDVSAGPGTGDPAPCPRPPTPWLETIAREPRRLRIAFSTETPLGDPMHADCIDAVAATAALCESLGHKVDVAQPVFDAQLLWTQFTTLLSTCVAWAMEDWSRRTRTPLDERKFEPFVWAFAERGRSVSAAAYLLAMQDLQAQVRAFSRLWNEYDLWLTPTLGSPPVPLGTLKYDGDPFALRRRSAAFAPFTYLMNATGQPAISLPLHVNAAGLPVGVQFTARFGEEDLLLGIAAELESARPWCERRPAVCAD